MVYTVTLNPSLDCVMELGAFVPGALNRAASQRIYPGGKGINVSIVCSRLGVESTALGFVAGFTGEELVRRVRACGCREALVRLESGLTRLNIKLCAGEESEINGPGPEVSAGAVEGLLGRLGALGAGDFLVLAGSIPPTVPADMYERALQALAPLGARAVVDATGELLLRALPYRPFLIKPNLQELEGLCGRPLAGEAAVGGAARRLQQAGARNVLVSLGGEGALLLREDGALLRGRPPAGRPVYCVGAGDSMVAGFLAGWLRSGDGGEALRWGLAAGSATAYSPWLAEGSQVQELLAAVQIGEG